MKSFQRNHAFLFAMKLSTIASHFELFKDNTMSTEDQKQREYLDKIDELLSARESKKEAIKRINCLIAEGLSAINGMPSRWYVRNTDGMGIARVEKYLSEKHDQLIFTPFQSGIGELHGKFAYIPHDVSYSWEITIEEFDLLMSKESKS